MKVRLKNRRLGRELARSRLSQNAWAKRFGLSSGHLANLVNGKRPYPDPATRSRLLEGLKLAFDDLFLVEESESRQRAGRQLDRPEGPPAGEDVDRIVGEETFMNGIEQDFRLGIRALRRTPGFFLAAVMTLFLGIGATTLIFSLVNTVMLRPLGFHDSDQLYLLWEANPDRNWHQVQMAPANFVDVKRQSRTFQEIGAYNDYLTSLTLQSNEIPYRLQASQITGDLLRVLGISPQIGKIFDSEDTWAGGDPVAVLSHPTWERFWGADPALIGRSILLNNTAFRVVGVMPSGFEFPFKEADLWIPTQWSPDSMSQVSFRRAHGMRAIGRLRSGVSVEDVERNLGRIAQELEQLYPATNRNASFGLTSLKDWIVGDTDQYLWMLLAAVSLLLIIACTTVANMLLALWTGRIPEIAIRVALGARRSRIIQQAIVEAVLLCLPSGMLALLTTWGIVAVLRSAAPSSVPRLSELSVDWTVLLLSFGLIVVATLLFGLLPARRYADQGPIMGLHQQGRSGSDQGSHLLSRALVVAQVAFALLLLAGGGLFARSFWNLNQVDPGFVDENGFVFGTRLPPNQYTEEAGIRSFYDQLLTRVRNIPGVEAATLTSRVPFARQRYSSDFAAERWEAGRYGLGIRHGEVVPGYFTTMGVPIVRGREFSERDRSDAPLVAVISQGLATQFFPDSDPIGQRIAFQQNPDSRSQWWEIVGVAGNVRRVDLRTPSRPEVYVPYAQDWAPGRSMYVVLRSRRDPAELIRAARSEVTALDPNLPIFETRSQGEIHEGSLAERKFFLFTLLAFAMASCTMSIAGVYGVLSHYLARRKRELGVRTALGATRRDLIREATRGGMRPVALGLLLGLTLTTLLTRTVANLLYGVRPLDPSTLLITVGLLAVVSLVSCLVPAYRASRVDPLSSLRAD